MYESFQLTKINLFRLCPIRVLLENELGHPIEKEEKSTINRLWKPARLRSWIINHIKKAIDEINSNLQNRSAIDLDTVGYVVCVDKLLMETFYIQSRNELLQLIKESYITDLTANPLNLIIMDQGEKEVLKMIQNSTLEPPSYYVHAHLSDEHIYLKLKQVVDISEHNGEESSVVYIKDKLITIDNLYEQVSEGLWNYIQLLDDEEKVTIISTDKFGNVEHLHNLFKQKMKRFIGEEVIYTYPGKSSS